MWKKTSMKNKISCTLVFHKNEYIKNNRYFHIYLFKLTRIFPHLRSAYLDTYMFHSQSNFFESIQAILKVSRSEMILSSIL